jgi:hypothetical protein
MPRLLWAILVGMVAQATSGLALPELYRDEAWIVTSWYGNDGVTLALACPLLLCALTGSRAQVPRWQLIRVGLLGYAVYNYAFYMLGAALNPAFLLYVILFVLAVIALVMELPDRRVSALAESFSPRTPIRLIGGYLVLVALGLAAVWAGMWARHVFFGTPTPATPEVFRLVAALDLGFMVPALALGGVLLWRRQPLGHVLASLAGVQAALYLLVLAVNSALMIHRGLAQWPGELVIWGPLCATTAAAVVLLLRHASASPIVESAAQGQ